MMRRHCGRAQRMAGRALTALLVLSAAACSVNRSGPSLQVPTGQTFAQGDSVFLIVRFEAAAPVDLLNWADADVDPALSRFDSTVSDLGGRWRATYPNLIRRVRLAPPDTMRVSPTTRVAIDRFASVFLPGPRSAAELATADSLLTAVIGVEDVHVPLPVEGSSAPICPTSPAVGSATAPAQNYLMAGRCGGVGAEYAWTVPGGDGSGGEIGAARVLLVDDYIPVCHEDLPVFERVLCADGGFSTHASRVAGVMAAVSNGVGVTGIAHGAEFYFGTYAAAIGSSNLRESIDLAAGIGEDGSGASETITPIGSGDIVVLPIHSPTVGGLVPVEVEEDVLACLQTLNDYGVVVVESAGNGSSDIDGELGDDSGAILVGAGVPPHRYPRTDSNYGSRVDCQAWGGDVGTTDSDVSWDHADLFGCELTLDACDTPLDDSYHEGFSQTSAATAVIGGVVASLQGAALAAHDEALTPHQMRLLLRENHFGFPQHGFNRDGSSVPAETTLIEQHVGPQPDLRRLLRAISAAPEAYLRDSIDDDYVWEDQDEFESYPLYGAEQYLSPDIIPQTAMVTDPEDVFLNDASKEDPHPEDADDPAGAGDATKVTHVYARAGNRGATQDDAYVQLFWAPASTYVSLGSLTPLGGKTFSGVEPGEWQVAGFDLSTTPSPTSAWVSWASLLVTPADPLYLLDAMWMFTFPLEYAREYPTLRYRNLGHAVANVKGVAAVEVSMRGYDHTMHQFELHFDGDLPTGTRVKLSMLTADLEWVVDDGASVKRESFSWFAAEDLTTLSSCCDRLEMEGIRLDAKATPKIRIVVDLPTGASAGTYDLWLEQHDPVSTPGRTLLGRYNFQIHLP